MSSPVPVGLVIGQLIHGGAERQLHALVQGMDRSRFRPRVFVLSEHLDPWGPRLEEAGAPVSVVPRRGHYDPRRILGLAAQFRRHGIKLVHAFLLEATVYAALARLFSGRIGLITSNRVALPGRNPVRRRLIRWAFSRSDCVLVNSNVVKEFTADTYHLSPEWLRVVYNGLDCTPYETARREEGVRQELGAGPDDLLVGTVGRLAPQKNPGVFLDVLEQVAGAEPRARFTWIGSGPLADSLTGGAAERGLSDRLVAAGERSDIPQVLKALDVFVLTSDTEGLPNAVLEAMAAGVPVVATDAGGTREAVGETGKIRPVGDAPGLATDVLSLLGDPEARRRAGEASVGRVRRLFARERMVAGTQDLYQEVLRERGRAG